MQLPPSRRKGKPRPRPKSDIPKNKGKLTSGATEFHIKILGKVSGDDV